MSHGRIAALDFPGVNWLQLALTTPVVFYSGAQFYRGAWAAFRHRAADMNTLIAVGTGAAYVYSVAATLAPQWFAGAVGMVGDGINDAPALAQADIGIAIGTGTELRWKPRKSPCSRAICTAS